MDHCSRRLALQGLVLQGWPGKPGILRHSLHRPGRGVRHHASLPATGFRGRWRARWASDLQGANVAAVRLAVADLHPAGFTGGLLPLTIVLSGEGGTGGRDYCQYREKEREKEEEWRSLLGRRDGKERRISRGSRYFSRSQLWFPLCLSPNQYLFESDQVFYCTSMNYLDSSTQRWTCNRHQTYQWT